MPISHHGRFLRWWTLIAAALFALYGVVIPDPHALNHAGIDHASWMVGAALMVVAAVWPSRGWRLLAMCFAAYLFLERMAVLIVFPSSLSMTRVIAGVVVWATLLLFVVVATLAAEIVDAPARLAAEK